MINLKIVEARPIFIILDILKVSNINNISRETPKCIDIDIKINNIILIFRVNLKLILSSLKVLLLKLIFS